jgi:predicted nucleotidyltransferase
MARLLLQTLEKQLKMPVDIEFASDGQDFYLLQCRPQTPAPAYAPAPIPKDIPGDRIVFTANRYVSNGHVSDITHIVYIDPQRYADLPDRADLLAVGRAVGRLNELLPKRQFILMGPGRWGSRGDIKLGVNVTYSDINNTGALIEVARKQGNYVPDVSFGTHFFQDLVEGCIHYLPLYPDDSGTSFNDRFLTGSPNILGDILPEYVHLSDTIHLIDVPRATNGLVLRLLMNADLDEALAMLAEPKSSVEPPIVPEQPEDSYSDTYWRWRWQICEQIASQLDAERFGVVAFYVFGSTKNATAGPASDIDLLIHVRSTVAQREHLECWLNGWSMCLDEINYLQSGYRSGGLLDVHLVTDEDIAKRTSYASKIGAVTDPARQLPIGKPHTESTRESV